MNRITIAEPNAVSITVPETAAAAVVRGWFCTEGTPAAVLELLRSKGLAGLYEYEDAGVNVAYGDVPEIGAGEEIGEYAERVADYVNAEIGASYDAQVRLYAAAA